MILANGRDILKGPECLHCNAKVETMVIVALVNKIMILIDLHI